MSVIPFPVCEYAAIHYKDGRRLEKLARAVGVAGGERVPPAPLGWYFGRKPRCHCYDGTNLGRNSRCHYYDGSNLGGKIHNAFTRANSVRNSQCHCYDDTNLGGKNSRCFHEVVLGSYRYTLAKRPN